LVSNSTNLKYLQATIQVGMDFNIKATTYFDFLTNNGTVFDVYMGGMNEFNFRMFN
jgi:hypothetical protein